jgi:hypothetical protein
VQVKQAYVLSRGLAFLVKHYIHLDSYYNLLLGTINDDAFCRVSSASFSIRLTSSSHDGMS